MGNQEAECSKRCTAPFRDEAAELLGIDEAPPGTETASPVPPSGD